MGNKKSGCAMTLRKIAVLLGGRSSEREISLVSGHGCAKALRDEGFETIEIDPSESDLAAQLNAAKPDAVFNALHGRWGEDGCVQGLLELLRMPYTHSGVLASALAMHKQRAKDVFAAAGLPLVKSIVVDRREAAARHLMEPPYVVKPVNEGSSVGVFIIRQGDNRPPEALGSDTWNLSNEMMVEEFVPGRELTVAVMGLKEGPRALAVTEITTTLAFYDYEAKYAAGGSTHTLPAKVPPFVAEQAMRLAERAHATLGCRGVSRIDFRYDDTEGKHRLVVLEANTQPGMTPTSLVPEQAAHTGMSYGALCRWIVEDASCDR
ncbi:MAG: D-alanine--D-alanine ligase [Alphaproteobacteria bacterium]|nr:D-alanine--D-alanine ligase [Alphaproteobacteria bacterium]